jgi:hypothetical protein
MAQLPDTTSLLKNPSRHFKFSVDRGGTFTDM